MCEVGGGGVEKKVISKMDEGIKRVPLPHLPAGCAHPRRLPAEREQFTDAEGVGWGQVFLIRTDWGQLPRCPP